MPYSLVSEGRATPAGPAGWPRLLSRARYRVYQFWAAVHAQVTPSELVMAREILPARAWPLFAAMPLSDQRHSLNVLHALRAQGYQTPADRDLLAAALLHDVAKADHLHLWHRVALVLLNLTRPGRGLLRWLARSAAPGHWRYPFYVTVHHPALGAAWALSAGCSAVTAWLIEQHQTPLADQTAPSSPRDAWLVALQKVDDLL